MFAAALLPKFLTALFVPRAERFEKVCAACQKERGEKPKANQSHTLCQRHLDQLREALHRDYPLPNKAA